MTSIRLAIRNLIYLPFIVLSAQLVLKRVQRENTDELYQLAFYDDGTFRLMQQIFIDNKLIREFEPTIP